MERMTHRSPLVVVKAKLCSNLSALCTTVRNLSTVRAGATLSWLAPRIVSSFFSLATGLSVFTALPRTNGRSDPKLGEGCESSALRFENCL